MKMSFATLLPLLLMAAPAAAETPYQSTMSGTVKIEAAPQDGKDQTQPTSGGSLTILFVPPNKPADDGAKDPAEKLRACGETWNKKLAEFEKDLPQLKSYRIYYDRLKPYTAQRPPKPAVRLLTRESYRGCMYWCLGNKNAECPPTKADTEK